MLRCIPTFVVYFREMDYEVMFCFSFTAITVTGYILKGHDVIILNEILIFFLYNNQF